MTLATVKRPSRSLFIGLVESYIGTPLVHRGRIPHKALDCVGLPIAACRAMGMEVEEPPFYGKLPNGATLRAGLMRYCRELPADQRVPGDILQVYAGKQARHVVVFTGVNKCGQHIVVHAWGKNARVQRAILDVNIVAAAWAIEGFL